MKKKHLVFSLRFLFVIVLIGCVVLALFLSPTTFQFTESHRFIASRNMAAPGDLIDVMSMHKPNRWHTVVQRAVVIKIQGEQEEIITIRINQFQKLILFLEGDREKRLAIVQ